jgi:hypothetical protein
MNFCQLGSTVLLTGQKLPLEKLPQGNSTKANQPVLSQLSLTWRATMLLSTIAMS